MGAVLTVAGGKGGVGKTTTSINAGIALQAEGYETVLVDADLGMTNLGAALDVDHEPRLHDVLAGTAAINEALADGPGGLSVLAGAASLDAFASAPPEKLEPVLTTLSRSFDCVIVDTGAGLSEETVVPMAAADGVLLVSTTSDLALDDAAKMADLAARVGTAVVGGVVTRADGDVDVESAGDRLGTDVLAVVPEDSAVESTGPLVLAADDRYAAQAYRQLAEGLVDQLDLVSGRAARS